MPGIHSPRFADEIGIEYDLLPLAIPHYQEVQIGVARLLADHVKGRATRVLEIGCGTGITTQKILELVPDVSIVALDNEAVMLEQARKRLQGDVRVTFIEADALAFLEFPSVDELFDAAVTVFCLHNMPPSYRRRVFVRMGAMTRRGGLIVSADKIAHNDILQHWKALRDQIDKLAVFQETPHPELQAKWTAHYLYDEAVRFTEREQGESLWQASCTQIECHRRWGMDALYSGLRE